MKLNLKKKVRIYSTGMKQKLALAVAFSDPVDILILDEPTSALIPRRAEILRLVKEAKGQGQPDFLRARAGRGGGGLRSGGDPPRGADDIEDMHTRAACGCPDPVFGPDSRSTPRRAGAGNPRARGTPCS